MCLKIGDKKDMLKKIAILIIMLSVPASLVFAQEDVFTAELERDNVSTGNPIYLNVTFKGGQNAPKPYIPPMDGLQIKYVGPATQVTIVNGKMSQSVTHAFLVIPLREGEYKIGPFSITYNGQVYNAPPVDLSVSGTPGSSGGVSPGGPYQGAGDNTARKSYAGDRLFLVIDVPRTQIYMNEEVPLTIKLFVDNMSLKEIEYPLLQLDGFSSGEWEEPQKSQENYQGKEYGTLTFRRKLFGIKEGLYKLGPATLRCKMISRRSTARRPPAFFRGGSFGGDDFADMFGQFEEYPVELSSNKVNINVLAFPEQNKPAAFKGAVGDFEMEVSVEPKTVKVGDPITVKTTISGRGNMDTVTAPEIKTTDGFKTYEPQANKKGKQKIYEQIFIPKTDEAKEIPGVSFSFFDPAKGKYVTLSKGPFSVVIQKQTETEKAVKVVTGGGAEETLYPKEKLGQDIVYIKDHIGQVVKKDKYLYRDPLFIGAQFVPLFIFFLMYGMYRRNERMRTDERYARFMSAPRSAKSGIAKARAYLAKNNIVHFYDVVFRTLQEYLGNKLGIPKGNVTGRNVEEKFKNFGGDEGIAKMVRDVFMGCDMARYASTVPDKTVAKEDFEKMQDIISYLEKTKI